MDEVNARIEQFRSFMKPALYLFPDYLVDSLKSEGFFTAPASSKFHSAFEGGLFEHSLNVTKVLVDLTQNNGLVWQRSESPYIVGMFHDLCKNDLYRHPLLETVLHTSNGPMTILEPYTSQWEHNPDAVLKGHGDKSVILLSQYLQLTMEEILCIRYHMGAFVDQKEWKDYTRAIHLFDTVLWTHHADMIATHVLESDKADPQRG